MKICGIVVTYYPNKEVSEKNILKYLPEIDHLIIWENTPQTDSLNYKLNLKTDSNKITYAGIGYNAGISYALNYAIRFAIENGYTHLLTIDQDSEWIEFGEYKEYVALNCIDSISIPLVNNELYNGITKYQYAITSGMLVPLNVYKRIGGYWEEFMVDGIDTEFIFRATSANIRIAKILKGRLIQIFGNEHLFRRFGKEFRSLGYSPSRLFGITRSIGIIQRKYKTTLSYKKNIVLYPIKTSIVILLSPEPYKLRKIRFLWLGLLNGFLCRKHNLKNLKKYIDENESSN